MFRGDLVDGAITEFFDIPFDDGLVSELADSSVNLTTRAWAKSADVWNIFFETTEKVKKAFDANDINIPFPQRDVHIYEQKE